MASDTKQKVGLFALSLGALGVVYGDIGTSPLYSVKEIFFSHEKLARDNTNVLGSISLIIWVLTIIITIKYIFIVMKADNHGEGGAFSLLSIVKKHKSKLAGSVTFLLVLSAALLIGDGIITPAISVTSAVEGLGIVAPSLQNFVVPVTVLILFALFAFQSKGTHRVGAIFGPIVFVWFVFFALLGLPYLVSHLEILKAFNPIYAIKFLTSLNLLAMFHVLGSVMLVITGGEALYADLGHFGKKAIRFSWFTVVFPCLIIGYLGQGAFLLSNEKIINENVFYSMVPDWLLIFSVVLATCATIIASQALISGVFSLVHQGIQLGLMPRLKIVHTYSKSQGQIYVPVVNWLLFVGCVGIVLMFRSSNNMAGAYGLTVSTVLMITTAGVAYIAYHDWKWNKAVIFVVFTFYTMLELLFVVANSLKFFAGAYVPFIIAIILYSLMSSWKWGRNQTRKYRDSFEYSKTIEEIIDLYANQPRLNMNLAVLSQIKVDDLSTALPASVERFIHRFGALPKRILFITAVNKNVPHISKKMQWSRMIISERGNIQSLEVNQGFMDEVSVFEPFSECVSELEGNAGEESNWVLFASRERLVVNPKASVVNKVRFYLYRTMYINAQPAYTYYGFSRDKRVAIELIPAEIG